MELLPEVHQIETRLFQATTTWFHVFRSMIESGDVRSIGPHSLAVYVVLKSYSNFSTGKSFPSISTIAHGSGVSDRQVKRSLRVLEEHGYIVRKRVGRRNEYVLREKVQLKSAAGAIAAVASWDYVPNCVARATADLKNVLVAGASAAQIIQIERLQVNITQARDNSVVINAQNVDRLPAGMRAALLRILTRCEKRPE